MPYFHIPVLLKEVIENVDPKSGENLIDGTVGGGGHAKAIMEKISPNGKLLGIDFEEEALNECEEKLKEYSGRIFFDKGNYADFMEPVRRYNFGKINIFFLDLGISSHQLDNEALGISFLKTSPLDMRLGGYDLKDDDRKTAEYIVNNYSEKDIESILKNYGEEKHANKIASAIVRERKKHRISNTAQLVDIISKSVMERYKKQRIHFATRTFQALRIAVNRELENLEKALPLILENLEQGGRIAIISYHSLEDRIVKNFFKKESKNCICGPEVPICACNHKKKLAIVTKKPIMAGEEELSKNPRARSAKLRVARKI